MFHTGKFSAKFVMALFQYALILAVVVCYMKHTEGNYALNMDINWDYDFIIVSNVLLKQSTTVFINKYQYQCKSCKFIFLCSLTDIDFFLNFDFDLSV